MLLWFYIYCQLTFTLKITLKNEENEAKHDKTHKIHSQQKNVKKLRAVNCLVWANKLICSNILK